MVAELRALPPAGGFPALGKVQAELKRGEVASRLVSMLTTIFETPAISLRNSGKSALEKIFASLAPLGIQRIIVGGYSCPDIVAAAVRSGLQVRPADLSTETLDFLDEVIDPETDAVILSNLYGLVDSTARFARTRIVDDACQAAFSSERGHRIGTRGLGVLSFGRGKAFCGIGGGAILGLKDRDSEIDSNTLDLAKLALASALEDPNYYILPASLPFLGLGKTVYDRSYSNSAVSKEALATALVSLSEQAETKLDYLRKTLQWESLLSKLPLTLPSLERKKANGEIEQVLIRFPVICPDERSRDLLFQRLRLLGVSKSYPAPLTDLCKGERLFESRVLPGARSISRRILTLPSHRSVSEQDVEKIESEIRRVLC